MPTSEKCELSIQIKEVKRPPDSSDFHESLRILARWILRDQQQLQGCNPQEAVRLQKMKTFPNPKKCPCTANLPEPSCDSVETKQGDPIEEAIE